MAPARSVVRRNTFASPAEPMRSHHASPRPEMSSNAPHGSERQSRTPERQGAADHTRHAHAFRSFADTLKTSNNNNNNNNSNEKSLSLTTDGFMQTFGTILNCSPEPRSVMLARPAESISNVHDEQLMHKSKGIKSDPIGCDPDLSSGGPLDEGIGFQLAAFPGISAYGASPARRPGQGHHARQQTWGAHETDRSSSSPDHAQIVEGAFNNAMRHSNDVVSSHRSRSMTTHLEPNSISHMSTSRQEGSPQAVSRPSLYKPPQQRDDVQKFHEAANHVQQHRKNIRAHTSEGIPLNKLRLYLGDTAPIVEGSVEKDAEDQMMKEQLQEELHFYKERTRLLEEQVSALMLAVNNSPYAMTPALSLQDGRPHLSNESHLPVPYRNYSPSALSSACSVPSMTMSPDPFSPFQQGTVSPKARNTQGEDARAVEEASRDKRSADERLIALAASQSMQQAMGLAGYHSKGDNNDLLSPSMAENAAEKAYWTGLRLNVSGIEPPEPRAGVAAAMANQTPSLPQEAKHSDLHHPGGLHSPFQQQPALQTSNSASGSPTALSGFTSPSLRSVGNGTYEERGNRFYGTDLHTPPEALVLRALSARNQEASIVLQQQLKTSSPARKAALLQAIAPHLLKLADDKHGNFLVQRAIGVEPQLAWRLQGRFVALSLSQFGCHVVQYLLDEEEKIRKAIVQELLSERVMETLTCKNSIHIWQKVLELHWTDDGQVRSSIFNTVNSTMKGRWADIAMLETGSIICQNIFESADENEKHDCLSEILDRLGECACNQWGVWVVQHIIEHSEPETKKKAFKRLIRDAPSLTLSQYGQKAVVSALKSRDQDFIAAYIDVLCDRSATGATGNGSQSSASGGSTRRSVLVDVSTAPQGVQIVTQLLTSVTPEQRERIIKTVRKNSVFLKGSKAGLRVHQLCERARAFTGY